MSKSGKKKNEGGGEHVVKSDVRHKYQVTELVDFSRRETRPDGTEKMMPRVAVLTPAGGGKQVRAYVPGNLDGPLEVGSMVMCRPHEQHANAEGPPVKFRITNVIDNDAEAMTAAQNAEFGAGKTGAGAPARDRQEAGVRR
jgi:hypothetical protein